MLARGVRGANNGASISHWDCVDQDARNVRQIAATLQSGSASFVGSHWPQSRIGR
jgi:hypothetical protein